MSRTGRAVAVGVAVVVGLAVLAVADAAAGGKHPLAVSVLGFVGAVVLITAAVAVPGRLLARPQGTRAGELGYPEDTQTGVDGLGEPEGTRHD